MLFVQVTDNPEQVGDVIAMAYVFLDKRTAPPVFRFQITEWDGPEALNFKGRRRTLTGVEVAHGKTRAQAQAETEAMARTLETRHQNVRLGLVEPPTTTDLGKLRAFEEVAAEYLEHGRAKGGLHGHPWGAKHAEKRAYYLKFWAERLGLKFVGDLVGCLTRFDRELIRLQKLDARGKPAGPASGKTKNNYADGLSAFCEWCVGRGLLAANPLKGWVKFEATKQTIRRALSVEEIRLFLEGMDGPKATPHSRRRRLGCELALASGLRRGELRSYLSVL